jgi:hypothetical protein
MGRCRTPGRRDPSSARTQPVLHVTADRGRLPFGLALRDHGERSF